MSGLRLLAPFAAWAGPLSEVPDEAFAEGLLGDGLALDPLEGVVRAPCDAEIIAVAPTGHSVPVREVRLSAGAGFVVAICGEIMTMPGLPKVPSAEVIRLNDQGHVEGLF